MYVYYSFYDHEVLGKQLQCLHGPTGTYIRYIMHYLLRNNCIKYNQIRGPGLLCVQQRIANFNLWSFNIKKKMYTSSGNDAAHDMQ